MMKKSNITPEEEVEILKQILISQVGYKKAQDLYECTIHHYDPLQYAVNKAIQELEKR